MGKTTGSRLGRRMKDRETLIGSSPRAARRRHGIRLHPRTIDAAGSTVVFDDGAQLAVSCVIWATGFGLDHAWIDLPVFEANGAVSHQRGVTSVPGVYFLGLPWQHTRGSALLGWVKHDAHYLADRIAAVARDRPPRRAT